MKRSSIRRFALGKESIRLLQVQLQQVRGGVPRTDATCISDCNLGTVRIGVCCA